MKFKTMKYSASVRFQKVDVEVDFEQNDNILEVSKHLEALALQLATELADKVDAQTPKKPSKTKKPEAPKEVKPASEGQYRTIQNNIDNAWRTGGIKLAAFFEENPEYKEAFELNMLTYDEACEIFAAMGVK